MLSSRVWEHYLHLFIGSVSSVPFQVLEYRLQPLRPVAQVYLHIARNNQ